MRAKKEKTHPAHVSKHNSNREKQVNLLMISNGEKRKQPKILALWAKSEEREAKSKGQRQWHYLALKNYQHY